MSEHIGGHRAVRGDEQYSNFSIGDLFTTKAGQEKARAEAEKILSDAQLQNAIAQSLNVPSKSAINSKAIIIGGSVLLGVVLIAVAAKTVFSK